MARVLGLLAVVAAVLAIGLPLSADDVTVKVITPAPSVKPTATPSPSPAPAATPVPSASPAARPAWVAPVGLGGDWMINQAFQMAKVTDEQKEKLKGTLDELAAATKADQDKASELMKKGREVAKAAKEAGKDVKTDPETKAAADAINQCWDENAKALVARREKLLGSLEGVLSADQIKTVRDNFDRLNPDLGVRNKLLARDWVKSTAPGVTLTDAQLEQVMTKAAPIQDRYGKQLADLQKAQGEKMQEMYKEKPADWNAAWKKVNDEFGPKFDELRVGVSKAMNEIVDSALTDEQRKQMAAGRQEAWKKSVDQWVITRSRSFDGLKLTDEQKAKVKELVTAAGEAMLKTDMFDTAGRNELNGRLSEDVKKLLTEEQLKMWR